jgi:hypothetical protein
LVKRRRSKRQFVRFLESCGWPGNLPTNLQRLGGRRNRVPLPVVDLHLLAQGLNHISSPACAESALDETERSGWEAAHHFMTALDGAGVIGRFERPLPREAAEVFNALAASLPAVFYIGTDEEDADELPTGPEWRLTLMAKDKSQPRDERYPAELLARGGTRYPDRRGIVLHLLRAFLSNPDRHRLKRCAQCSRWFVDTTLIAGQARCSEKCTWAFWSRERRAAVGLARAKRRPRRSK